MAAKNDELVEKLIKGGIIVAVLVIGYMLYKKLFSGNGTGAGQGTGTGSGNSSGVAGTLHNVAQKLEHGAETVINKIANNVAKTSPAHFDPETAKAVQLGLNIAGLNNVIPFKGKVADLVAKLQKADQQAAMFHDRPGTTPQINSILKAVDGLADQEFILVMNSWKNAAGYTSIYYSHLAGAKLTTHSRSLFLQRLNKLNLL